MAHTRPKALSFPLLTLHLDALTQASMVRNVLQCQHTASANRTKREQRVLQISADERTVKKKKSVVRDCLKSLETVLWRDVKQFF